MWTKPWTYKEGIATGIALPTVGMLLQLTTGPINWDLFAMPANVIFLVIYIISLLAAYFMRGRIYAVRWSMTYHAAVPAILIAGAGTVIYGITCDRSTLSAWPFVILYFWLTTILGLTCIRQIHHLAARKSSFSSSFSLYSHLGLFIAIVAATLGSADMEKLRIVVHQEMPEYRATDDNGKVHELDVAIQLNHFAIEEYPPKLLLIDNETGAVLTTPEGENIAPLELDIDGEHSYNYNGINIRLKKVLPYSAMSATNDTVNYVEWAHSGATTAALIDVIPEHGEAKRNQWISNGSYMFPYRPIRIDEKTSLVMPECEPKRFTSNVNVYTKSGEVMKDVDIEVNKPLEIAGWKIYQLSYDETKGRWSDVSVLELVRDPWLPAVYAGIVMLLIGAVLMFLTAGGKKQ